MNDGDARSTRRKPMEASENAGLPLEGRGGTGLHRLDPDRVGRVLADMTHASGFPRLELMVNTVFARLVAEPGADAPPEHP